MVLGDGAIWIWNLAMEQFPGAILIVDFYHAGEYLHKLSRILFPSDEAARRAWTTSAVDLLDKEIESLVAVVRSLVSIVQLRALALSDRWGPAIELTLRPLRKSVRAA